MPTVHAAQAAQPLTDAGIVAAYMRKNRAWLAAELAWFSSPASPAQAIERAARARGENGNRLSHQYRLSEATIGTACAALAAAKRRLWKANDFDELFAVVEDEVLSIPGIGPLYVYDTALRIGAFRGMLPQRVYLHAGSRIGGKLLLQVGRAATVEVDQFPAPYRQLAAHELENLLCSYRRNIAARLADRQR